MKGPRMADQEMCSCKVCSPVIDETICNMMAGTNARYHDAASQAAAMAINNQQNLQSMFNVKAQQMLEARSGERMGEMIALLSSVYGRVPAQPAT